MKKNKKGFTLAEVLICMVIVGMIMVVAMNAIRIVKASYTSLTYFTYKNLKDMVGTVYSGQTAYTEAYSEKGRRDEKGNLYSVQEGDDKKFVTVKPTGKNQQDKVSGYEQLTDSIGRTIPNPTTYCRYDVNGEYSILSVLKNDNEYETENTAMGNCTQRTSGTSGSGSVFCKALSGILNSTGKVFCDSGKLREVAFDATTKEPYISDIIRNNTTGKITTAPNFITTNGQSYYLSKWQPPAAGKVSPKYGYRIIAVDLNGKTGPNKVDKSAQGEKYNSNPPDIVQFLILDNGQVYPLGLAADNMHIENGKRVQYLTSQIKGYYFDSENAARNQANIPEECKKMSRSKYDKNGNIIDNTYSFNKTTVNDDGSVTENEETRSGNTVCNFARVDIQNSEENTFFTYREAYCSATPKENIEYENYCNAYGKNYQKSDFCPPVNLNITLKNKNGEDASPFDECRVVNIKPMFRYNFK